MSRLVLTPNQPHVQWVLVSSMYGPNCVSPCSAKTRTCVVALPVQSAHSLDVVVKYMNGWKEKCTKIKELKTSRYIYTHLTTCQVILIHQCDYHHNKIFPHCNVMYNFPEKYHNNAYMLGKCVESLNAILIFFLIRLRNIILLKTE